MTPPARTRTRAPAAALLSRVAVLVVSYNTAGALERCLQSLTGGSAPRLAVLVVDNASTDGSAAMVRDQFPAVQLEAASENLGFGRAANLAAARTDRDFLLVLNPDCIVGPEAVAELAQRLAENPALGYAGPKILLGSGRVDHACLRADPDPLGAALYLSRVTRFFPGSARVNRYSLRHLDYNQEQDLIAGTAACLMVRAAAFAQIGGFDEDYFMYGEDLDLCRRLRQAGYAGRYVPSAEVMHLKGEASRQQSGRMLVEFHRAMWLYYRKHESADRSPLVNGLVATGIGAVLAGRLAANALRHDRRVSPR
jgi:GT2 family glycosyltransferase